MSVKRPTSLGRRVKRKPRLEFFDNPRPPVGISVELSNARRPVGRAVAYSNRRRTAERRILEATERMMSAPIHPV